MGGRTGCNVDVARKVDVQMVAWHRGAGDHHRHGLPELPETCRPGRIFSGQPQHVEPSETSPAMGWADRLRTACPARSTERRLA